jgi:hypothetical protein
MLGILNVRNASANGDPERAPLLSIIVTTQHTTATGMLIHQMNDSKRCGQDEPGTERELWFFPMPRGGVSWLSLSWSRRYVQYTFLAFFQTSHLTTEDPARSAAHYSQRSHLADASRKDRSQPAGIGVEFPRVQSMPMISRIL